MLKNYLKIAFRNITRHKGYAIINISGLAIGMASSILILLWVQHELSYDRFHEHANQLYRITCNAGDFKAAVNPAAMPAGLKAQMPEIKQFVRFSHPATTLFETGNRKFTEEKVFYADSNLLQQFSFRLLQGDATTAMQRPDAVLLTASMATKYFGTQDALGKLLRRNNGDNVTVTGVLANLPANSHIQFDFIMPMAAIAHSNEDLRENKWDAFNFYSYLQLNENFAADDASLKKLQQRIDAIYKKKEPNGVQASFQLQPLTAIHLHSNFQVDLPGHGNAQYVNIFFIVAIFILVVACINFMNLATARSARRAREVGLRKVVGALRVQLIGQFMGEAMLTSFAALLVAVLIVLLTLPLFNQLSGKALNMNFLDAKMLTGLGIIAVATGLISGSYPALFLSGFKPVKVLKGNLKWLGGNLLLRNGLVVTQFIVSIVLLSGTVIIYRQLQFIKDRNPGFVKNNLLYMPMTGDMWGRQQALRAELQRQPLTRNYAIVSELPVNIHSGNIDILWEGKDPKSQVVIPSMEVSEQFIDVFQMTLLNGRNFSAAFRADSNNFILNQKAVAVMGMTTANAIGKSISFNNIKGMIVGVVKDFNFKPLQQQIEPLILRLNKWGGTVILRTETAHQQATIAALESISHQLNPAFPFSYNFLDQDLANLYRGDQQMGNIFNLFALLAIFISCLGLYGLSAFIAQQRTREIGVRKVLGASTASIVYLLSNSFTRLILIAAAIAIPLSWFAINSWLQGFAYHINIGWMVFLYAVLAALFIAWATVSFESIKAAISNPVKSLRAE